MMMVRFTVIHMRFRTYMCLGWNENAPQYGKIESDHIWMRLTNPGNVNSTLVSVIGSSSRSDNALRNL